jgi:hypothetical protein
MVRKSIGSISLVSVAAFTLLAGTIGVQSAQADIAPPREKIKPKAEVAPVPTPPATTAAIVAKVPPIAKPVPPSAPPAPAPEIAAMMKDSKGTWKCKGTAMMPDGSSTPMTANMTSKVTLGGYWIRTTFTQTGSKTPYNFEASTGYDAANKTWHRVSTDNMGGHEISTSMGAKNGSTTWEATSHSMMGTGLARHYEEMVGKDLKMWGEWSMDKGKTWNKSYDSVCKR